jgi:hypothetical protein
MSKHEKLVQKILSGRQDKAIDFSDAVTLLRALRFSQRIRGDHHIFDREDIKEIINIQPDGAKAKAYQVKQIRELIIKYRLEVKDE